MIDATVIIQQSDKRASRAIEMWLRRSKVSLGDVSFVDNLIRAEQELIPDERQLLIFGSNGGIMHGIPDQVQAMRDQNTGLICALYTMSNWVSDDQLRHFPVEVCLDKRRDVSKNRLHGLITTINDFRAGKLCRDNSRSWHHAPEEIKQEFQARF